MADDQPRPDGPEESGQEEQEKRVEMGDVLRVLAKHAAPPNDPDDAGTLTRFNEQVAEEQQKGQEPEREEAPQQGSQPRSPRESAKESPEPSRTRKDK